MPLQGKIDVDGFSHGVRGSTNGKLTANPVDAVTKYILIQSQQTYCRKICHSENVKRNIIELIAFNRR